MRNPASPGYNLEWLDRELRFPMLSVPSLAVANEPWKVEHGAQFAQRPVLQLGGMQRTLARDSA